jgi:hypothetical protein
MPTNQVNSEILQYQGTFYLCHWEFVYGGLFT